MAARPPQTPTPSAASPKEQTRHGPSAPGERWWAGPGTCEGSPREGPLWAASLARPLPWP